MRARLTSFLRTNTAKLAGTYLLIIMLMSIGFSIVFYNTSSHELGRQIPPHSLYYGQNQDGTAAPPPRPLDDFFQQRAQEGRHALMLRLIALNVGALLLGALAGYYLARRTLRPIEDAMAAQIQFVSDASHELRTPLAALQVTNEVALRKPKLSTKEAKDLIGYNVEEVIRLKTLSDALLGLLNDNHIIDKQTVDVQLVIGDAMNSVIPAATQKSITVNDNTLAIKVKADAMSLQQVFTILLDNAVKYGRQGGSIWLDAKATPKTIEVSVRDDGDGIAEEDLPHIFKRFYRADKARTRQAENGYGLGLSIAERIVQQHGGTISVTSKVGAGTCFIVKLPLN